MKHQLFENNDFTDKEYERNIGNARWVIDGGLAICKVCGGAESTLPSQCPGRKMTEDEQAAIYSGKLDYTINGWLETL